MARLLMLALFMALVAAIAVAVKSCSAREPHDALPITDKGELVALRDGSTLVAEKGTVSRDLVDWLAGHGEKRRAFEVGGQEFVGRSADLTAESIGRIPRFAAMLRANPDVDVIVVGHSDPSGNVAKDIALSRARAEKLVDSLAAEGIARERLKVEARGSAEPIASNDTEMGRSKNQRVSVILIREK